MNQEIFAIVLSFIAGLSTLIGTLFMIFSKRSSYLVLSFTFAFSFIVILFICIFDLALSSYKYFILSSYFPFAITIIFIIIGIYFGKLLDKIKVDNNNYDKKLYRVGIISFIILVLHNIPEGIITYVTSYDNLKFGIMMCLAISFHNIPEGIMISMPIYYATKSRLKAFIYTLISALSEPFGAIISFFFLSKFISDRILGIILAIVCGLMLHIVLDEIYPLTKKYNDKKYRIIGFISGIILIIVLEIFT